MFTAEGVFHPDFNFGDFRFAVASYELDSLDVLQSPAYRAIAGQNLSVWSKRVTAMCTRVLRFEGTQTLPGDEAAPDGAGGLLVNAMNVDPAHEAEFNEWYDTSTSRDWPRSPARSVPGAYATAAVHTAIWRCTTLPPRTCRPPRPGRPPPTRRGPTGCGRISATTCAS